MSKKVLILMEGRAEKRLFSRLSPTFGMLLEEGGFSPVVLETSIYELYAPLIESGDFDDLPSYLCSIGKIKCQEGERPKDMFSLIYLIFDFDPQHHKFEPGRIQALQRYFSDETKNGLLYINYPMVESIFDVVSLDGKPTIPCSHDIGLCQKDGYKKYVRKETVFRSDETHVYRSLPNDAFALLGKLSMDRYKSLMNLLRGDEWGFSDLKGLLDKEIEGLEERRFYPLSCFPFMALDYNAQETLRKWDSEGSLDSLLKRYSKS